MSKHAFIILLLLFFCISHQSIAQDVDEFFSMSPAELANISVSIATGTAKPIHQSASITSVITADQIKVMGATELDQVLETVAGLHVSIQPITNDSLYSMRGVRNAVNNQVLFLLNGVRFSVPYKGSSVSGMELPVEAIQRIEIIRGPGSALYGADAFIGVINIITKKAKNIDGTQLGIRGGSWDTQSIWGLHSEQWLGWDIAATLQYAHNNNDDDRIIKADGQSQLDLAFSTNASLAPGAVQTKAERWNAHLNLQRQHWDIDFWAFNKVNSGLRAGTSGALDNEGDADNENYLIDVKFSTENLVPDWQFLAQANYLYTNLDSDLHLFPDGSVLPINANGIIDPTASMGISIFPDGMITQIGIENQIAAFEISALFSGFDNHLIRINTGFRYEQVSTTERRNFGQGIIDGSQPIVDGILTNVTGTDLVFLPDSHRSIWSVVLQDEWQFAQNWQLTAGVRYDEYSDFGSTINPRVALLWNINQQFSSKLLYGLAFRAPSFLEQKQQNSQLFIGTPDLRPETIETIELAFDYRPYNNLTIASNFYYYEIRDQILGSGGDSTGLIENTAGQDGYGTEFEWDWTFCEQWNIKGNYAWQYSRQKGLNKRAEDVPEHLFHIAVAWAFIQKWHLQTQLNWVGQRTNAETQNKKLKDYETVDITLNSQKFFNVIDFTASVRNVFNSHGKEPAIARYPNNLPIASRSFYFETSLSF